jgi:hypothetical protein
VIAYTGTYKSRGFFQIAGQLKIDSSPIDIWRAITEEGHLKNFHTYCALHKKMKWDGVGSKDIMEFYSGRVMNREVVAWDEGRSYQIKMNNNDSNRSEVSFEIIKNNDEAFFKITVETDAYRKTPRPIWFLVVRFVLVPSYKKYLNSICNGLKYYCETGKKVRKNQFGSHKKFSP